MGRNRLIGKTDKRPDTFNLSLPNGYVDGKLLEMREHFGISPSHIIHHALEELWIRKDGPPAQAVERFGDIGLADVIPDYRQHDFNSVIREANHLILRTVDFDQFYTANRRAFLTRLKNPKLSTLILLIKRGEEWHTNGAKDFTEQARNLTSEFLQVDKNERDAPLLSRITFAVVSSFQDAPLFALWTEKALYSTPVTEATHPESKRVYPSYALVWHPDARLNEWHYVGANLAAYERFYPYERVIHCACKPDSDYTPPDLLLFKSHV
ncbi:hypothetical protein CFBP5875_04765 [Agrobacterium pusense]|uniref:hypothetical protein n=1 Tax=Agrobacterium pusense TaxID=648995 RepID=UPI0010BEDB00|nr:hypothetical protein [Agrobacterium pusense]QCL83930.1 hypothetical protein CFBP5875_04765 [Agrobacterium pusense]